MLEQTDQLLEGIKNKELKAFEEIFFKYHGRLVLFALKFTGDLQTAKDIVQDAFLILWEKSENINSSPKAYLFQSVRNNSLNHVRHQKIGHTVKDEFTFKMHAAEKAIYSDFNTPYFSLLELEMEQKIEEVVNSLPEKCLEVFKLSRHKHLKNKEIAKELGVSLKTVEKHISKALSILRQGLSEYMGTLILILLKNL